MNIIQSTTINSDANGKWRWNFNPQVPGTYRIEVIPKASDGTEAPPYYKDIVVTQEEIDNILAYKRKKYYKILNHDTPNYDNGQLKSILFEKIPIEIMYPGEQDIRLATIKFNQSYWYSDGDESIIRVLLVETANQTNIISNLQYTTENENGNYTDPADDGYDPNEVSIIKNVEFDPKIIEAYDSVTLKLMRELNSGSIVDVYENDIPLLDYDGTLVEGTTLSLVDTIIGNHPDSTDNYRVMNYEETIAVGQELENIIITSDNNNSLNFNNMKVLFKITLNEYESDGTTIKYTNTIIIDNNIMDTSIDSYDTGYIFKPIIVLPYLYSFNDGEIEIIYEATLNDNSVIDVITFKYVYN